MKICRINCSVDNDGIRSKWIFRQREKNVHLKFVLRHLIFLTHSIGLTWEWKWKTVHSSYFSNSPTLFSFWHDTSAHDAFHGSYGFIGSVKYSRLSITNSSNFTFHEMVMWRCDDVTDIRCFSSHWIDNKIKYSFFHFFLHSLFLPYQYQARRSLKSRKCLRNQNKIERTVERIRWWKVESRIKKYPQYLIFNDHFIGNDQFRLFSFRISHYILYSSNVQCFYDDRGKLLFVYSAGIFHVCCLFRFILTLNLSGFRHKWHIHFAHEPNNGKIVLVIKFGTAKTIISRQQPLYITIYAFWTGAVDINSPFDK